MAELEEVKRRRGRGKRTDSSEEKESGRAKRRRGSKDKDSGTVMRSDMVTKTTRSRSEEVDVQLQRPTTTNK